MSAKFSVGQKVIRIQDNEPKAATVLQVIDNGVNSPFSRFCYQIQYNEGATDGNNGTGFWTENSLNEAA